MERVEERIIEEPLSEHTWSDKWFSEVTNYIVREIRNNIELIKQDMKIPIVILIPEELLDYSHAELVPLVNNIETRVFIDVFTSTGVDIIFSNTVEGYFVRKTTMYTRSIY